MPKNSIFTKKGFTLIELLVVVALIAALSSLSFLAAQGAKGKANGVRCVNNLHQIGAALQLYSHDYERFPGHYLVPCQEIVYPKRLLPYVANQISIWNCPAEKASFYWTNDPVSLSPIVIRPATTGFCYGYNDMGSGPDFSLPYGGLGGDLDPAGVNPWNHEPKDSVVKVPSDMICIADAVSDNNWDTSIEPDGLPPHPGDPSSEDPEWPSRRHGNGSFFLYVDGHIAFHAQKDAVSHVAKWRQKWNSDHEPHL